MRSTLTIGMEPVCAFRPDLPFHDAVSEATTRKWYTYILLIHLEVASSSLFVKIAQQ